MPEASPDQVALNLPPIRVAAATPKSADRQRWGMLAGGVLVMILLSNYQYCFTLFTPGMKQQFTGVPYSEIALIFSIFVLFETWPVPFVGGLIDRFGIRRLMLIGSVMIGHHLIMFARAASSGKQNASNYSVRLREAQVPAE